MDHMEITCDFWGRGMSGGDDIACFTRVSRGPRAFHEAHGRVTRPTGVSVAHVYAASGRVPPRSYARAVRTAMRSMHASSAAMRPPSTATVVSTP